jgi:hypothetical protein
MTAHQLLKEHDAVEKKHSHHEQHESNSHKKTNASELHRELNLANPEVSRHSSKLAHKLQHHHESLPHEVGQTRLPTIDVQQHSSTKKLDDDRKESEQRSKKDDDRKESERPPGNDDKKSSDSKSRDSDSKTSDSKPSDPKSSDSKPSDPKSSDSKPSDPKPSDPKPSDQPPINPVVPGKPDATPLPVPSSDVPTVVPSQTSSAPSSDAIPLSTPLSSAPPDMVPTSSIESPSAIIPSTEVAVNSSVQQVVETPTPTALPVTANAAELLTEPAHVETVSVLTAPLMEPALVIAEPQTFVQPELLEHRRTIVESTEQIIVSSPEQLLMHVDETPRHEEGTRFFTERRVNEWTPEYETVVKKVEEPPAFFFDQPQQFIPLDDRAADNLPQQPIPDFVAEPSAMQKAVAQAIAADPNNTTATNQQPQTPVTQSNGEPTVGSGFVGEIDPDSILPQMLINSTSAGESFDNLLDRVLQHTNDARNHKVQEGQTLEEIAVQHYGDMRYADLIFRMNMKQIPAKFVGTRKLRLHLLPNTKLRLPTPQEIQDFMQSGLLGRRRSFEYEERRKRQA